MVGVAQLVEPQIVDLVVVGSSPIVHPTLRWERGRPALTLSLPHAQSYGNIADLTGGSHFLRTTGR